jgi:hypothetical protein
VQARDDLERLRYGAVESGAWHQGTGDQKDALPLPELFELRAGNEQLVHVRREIRRRNPVLFAAYAKKYGGDWPKYEDQFPYWVEGRKPRVDQVRTEG